MRDLIKLFFTVFVTLGITAACEQPIKDFFGSDRLEAVVLSGPWIPYPAKDGKVEVPEDAALIGVSATELINNNFRFAVLRLRNNGRSEITDATIKFDELISPDVYIPSIGKQPAQFVKKASIIELPTIKPGMDLRIFMWKGTDLSWSYYLDDIKTSSNKGAFRLSIDAPSTIKRDSDYFYDGIFEWIDYAFVGAGLALLALFFAGATASERYYKKLLNDSDFYLEEQVRLETEGKKWVPKF